MENKPIKTPENQKSENSALERGKAAIEADKKINKKDLDKTEVEKESQKDAEQWRNEG